MKLTAGQPKSILAGPIGQPEKKLSMTPDRTAENLYNSHVCYTVFIIGGVRKLFASIVYVQTLLPVHSTIFEATHWNLVEQVPAGKIYDAVVHRKASVGH